MTTSSPGVRGFADRRSRGKCPRRCWTRASICVRSGRCTGSSPRTGQSASAGRNATHPNHSQPEVAARAANEVWSWDIRVSNDNPYSEAHFNRQVPPRLPRPGGKGTFCREFFRWYTTPATLGRAPE